MQNSLETVLVLRPATAFLEAVWTQVELLDHWALSQCPHQGEDRWQGTGGGGFDCHDWGSCCT